MFQKFQVRQYKKVNNQCLLLNKWQEVYIFACYM